MSMIGRNPWVIVGALAILTATFVSSINTSASSTKAAFQNSSNVTHLQPTIDVVSSGGEIFGVLVLVMSAVVMLVSVRSY